MSCLLCESQAELFLKKRRIKTWKNYVAEEKNHLVLLQTLKSSLLRKIKEIKRRNQCKTRDFSTFSYQTNTTV